MILPSQPSTNTDPIDPAHTALSHIARLRADTWNRLRDYARQLRRVERTSAEAARLVAAAARAFAFLKPLEAYHAFPGPRALNQIQTRFERGAYESFARQTIRLVRLFSSNAYRRLDLSTTHIHEYSDVLNQSSLSEAIHENIQHETRPYFEVLVVDDMSPHDEAELHERLMQLRRPEDQFIYRIVVVHTFEDALSAALVNVNIQCCVVRFSFPFASANRLDLLDDIYELLRHNPDELKSAMPSARSLLLGRALKELRPELDLFLVTDAPVEDVAGDSSRDFRRVLYHQENYKDLHLSILKGIHERFETPFFEALRRYSQKPTGVFHALPISRGNSIARSNWIQDMARFYGNNIFQAETSATTGGLDSLLQPHGSLKSAQELAARAFGSRQTFFVTNGTSTANKIVLQSLLKPGDIVLLSHDCHKSHHYAMILAGGCPVYLDAYPLQQYSMYGGVPLSEIKRNLIALARAGKLDRVKMLLLTNITFDGITYDPERIMHEVLAIKPDMIFVWDEAWFAYGRFLPLLRKRTAMAAASRLSERYRSEQYRAEYAAWRAGFDPAAADDDSAWIENRLWPDPDRVRVRVYATQSTHKTLTALRQGSMIHVHDQDFEKRVRSVFHEAYMTHTSTSPNYQILASLDVGRRQMELEGYEFVQRSVELAMTLRRRIGADPLLGRYFRVLGPNDMVPSEYRSSDVEGSDNPSNAWELQQASWRTDEFVLDPTRLTIDVGRTGMDGDTFKNMLIDRFDIQINKTSRNSVLFMIHIGMTRGMIAHLVKILTQIARELSESHDYQSDVEQALHEQKVDSLTRDLPPLPNFSRFHPAFLRPADSPTPEGDIRTAFFLAYDDSACEYLKFDGSLTRAVESGRDVVSASFVIPYPPGFPILMPGQVMTAEILSYLKALDVKEIHGYEPDYGLRVFTQAALDRLHKGATRKSRATNTEKVEGARA